MDELLNPPQSDEPAPSMVRDSARFVLGLALMAAGVAIVLGGFVLYFGNKSGRLVTFPFAGGLTILVGGLLLVVSVFLDWGRVEIGGCGHLPYLSHPDELADVVRGFLTPPAACPADPQETSCSLLQSR